MAGRLMSLEDAAKLIGVSPDELSEMRQRQEIYGIRDGANWKFKEDDLLRVKQERDEQGILGPKGSGGSGDELTIELKDSGISLDLPDLGESKGDVVLSELELGESGPGSSTIIGKGGDDADIELKSGSGAGSGLNLLGDSDAGSTMGVQVGPLGRGGDAPGTSDIDLGLGGSGLNLLGESDIGSTGGAPVGGGVVTPAPGGSDVNLGGPSGLGLMGSDVRLAPTSEVGKKPGPDSSNVLKGGSSGGAGSSAAGRTMLTAELADRPESSVKLTMRDSESVFGDEGGGSANIHESGINLLDTRDSGLALDDLNLASSTAIRKKKKGQPSDLGMQSEDDFLLTPLEEQTDESTDSGSQVIALEGEFGEDATATIMRDDVPGLGAMLGEGGGLAPAGMPGQLQYVTAPEPSYGVFAVLFLSLSSIVMLLVGVMMYDIVRNMWSWDTPYSFNSTLMDMILSIVG